MIKSMTGYGKQTVSANDSTFTVEIRTLNSKQLDVNLKVPSYLKEKEVEIRKLISNKLSRGKIDVGITIDQNSVEDAPVVDKNLASHYKNQIDSLSETLGIEPPAEIMHLILKMPDIMVQKDVEADEKDIDAIYNCLVSALENVDMAREKEGKDLETDFKLRINNILQLLEDVDKYDENRVERIRERIRLHIKKYLNDLDSDNNRLEQEIIYYLEKLDITEEKVRLKNNCAYFLENIENDVSSGKKLGFITQEIGREINTLGSKANDSDLQRIVVLMKDELEKIKEQLFNIL